MQQKLSELWSEVILISDSVLELILILWILGIGAQLIIQHRITKEILLWPILLISRILIRFLNFWRGRNRKNGDAPLGSAYFMKGWERFRFANRFKESGIYINGVIKIPLELAYRGILVLGGMGAGKSSLYSIVNILLARFSFIAMDPSGELGAKCSGLNHVNGFNVVTFDPTSPNSARFNPLHRIEAGDETGAAMVAQALIQTAYPSASGNAVFFNTAAENILTILINLLKRHEDQRVCHLGNVRRLLNMIGTNEKALAPLFAEYGTPELVNEWKGIMSESERTLSSIVSTARQSLNIWKSQDVVRLTASDTLTFEDLRKKKTALFIRIPEEDLEFYKPITSLLYSALMKFAMKQPTDSDQPIHFILEEIANCGFIPSLDVYAVTLRKRKVVLSYLLQEFGQLETLYGRERARTIIGGGTGTKIFLPGLPIETCQKIEAMLGRTSVVHEDEEGRRKTLQRPLLYADEVRTIADNEALVISANRQPLLLRTKPYYKNYHLNSLTSFKPYVPEPPGEEGVLYLEIPALKGGLGEPPASGDLPQIEASDSAPI